MTTEQMIKQIRTGIPLITNATSECNMLVNQGFSAGQISTRFADGSISLDDWKALNSEVELAVKAYKEKNKNSR